MPNEVKLLPCRACGAICRVETFGPNKAIAGSVDLFICSNNRKFGGNCPSERAYFGASFWNEANTRPTTVVTDEVVERVAMERLIAASTTIAGRLDMLMPGTEIYEAIEQARSALASMPTVVIGEQPLQSVGDHALPCSASSPVSRSRPKAAAAIARKGA